MKNPTINSKGQGPKGKGQGPKGKGQGPNRKGQGPKETSKIRYLYITPPNTSRRRYDWTPKTYQLKNPQTPNLKHYLGCLGHHGCRASMTINPVRSRDIFCQH